MHHIYLIYGNQPLELEEEIEQLSSGLLPPGINANEAVFNFDIEDFFSKDQNQNLELLNRFKNTCETVSFFSPVILVQLKNLQNVISTKKNKQPLENQFEKIKLVKSSSTSSANWFDSENCLLEGPIAEEISCNSLIKRSKALSKDRYQVELKESWKTVDIIINAEGEARKIPVTSFLVQKLGLELEFGNVEDDQQNYSKGISSDFFNLLKHYLEKPPKDVEIILTANIKNTRELNKELFSLISKNGKIIKKTVTYDDARPIQWVMQRCKSRGLSADQECADLLIEFLGSDFSILDNEITKLKILLGDKPLKPQTIVNSVSQSRTFSIYRITDSLLKKDLRESLESLRNHLRSHPSDYVSVLALIASQFRKALMISWMTLQDIPENGIVSQLGMNPWLAKQLIKQISDFSAAELENIVVFLSNCDIQLKYASRDSITILENMCFRICQNEFKRSKSIRSRWLP